VQTAFMEVYKRLNDIDAAAKQEIQEKLLIFDRLDKLDDVKAADSDLVTLKNRVDKFSSIEHINEIKTVLMPKLESFSNQIDEFMKDNQLMRECIRRFDEDLSMKANKGELITIRTSLEKTFISMEQWIEVEKAFLTL
jgi:hypothetical protein